jgi:hypothetical protein
MDELIFSDPAKGDITFTHISMNFASVDWISALREIAKNDPKRRSMFAFPLKSTGNLPLHLLAMKTEDLAVLTACIEAYPRALLHRNLAGETPVRRARRRRDGDDNLGTEDASAAVYSCLDEFTRRERELLNQTAVKLCLVDMKGRGMTKYVASCEINDLTPPQFAFMVLDTMVNCEMKNMAEDIISYVGCKMPLDGEAGFTDGDEEDICNCQIKDKSSRRAVLALRAGFLAFVVALIGVAISRVRGYASLSEEE